MSDLKGKTAIVTGAGRGIGAAIARCLSDRGAAVAVNDLVPDRIAAVAEEINGTGGKAVAIQGDITRAADVDRMFRESEAALGKLDILVANAGSVILGPVADITEEDYRRSFDTNAWGLVLMGQRASRYFSDEGGSLIAIGSAITWLPQTNSLLYGASKAAVDHITRVLALELGPRNIRVNAVLPGMIETDGSRAVGGMEESVVAATIARTPLGRLGYGDDVARVVAFLASEDARWVTGQLIGATGGLY